MPTMVFLLATCRIMNRIRYPSSKDMAAIEQLLPFFRASGKVAEAADALEKAALVTEAPERRAAFCLFPRRLAEKNGQDRRRQ